MERNKLENEFREQLNSREIKPSDRAWNKLDAMLTAEEKNPKRRFSWIYIAASLLGFIFLGTFFFSQTNNNTTVEGKEIVVQNNQKVVSKEQTPSIIPKKSIPESVVVTSKPQKGKRNYPVTNSIIKSQLVQNYKSDSLNSLIEKEQVNQKKEQFASSNINDNSVDEMLASVKIASKSSNSKTAIKVNPNTLLSQVDGELELSFREKVINKINKNYQTVKVVLANRNQE
jgi:hypothetical protein